MGISAVIGYCLKLALLSNLGAPDAGSVGVSLCKSVWRAQDGISLAGLGVLTVLIIGNGALMLYQYPSWSFKPPYV
jgi:hypothetical protein